MPKVIENKHNSESNELASSIFKASFNNHKKNSNWPNKNNNEFDILKLFCHINRMYGWKFSLTILVILFLRGIYLLSLNKYEYRYVYLLAFAKCTRKINKYTRHVPPPSFSNLKTWSTYFKFDEKKNNFLSQNKNTKFMAVALLWWWMMLSLWIRLVTATGELSFYIITCVYLNLLIVIAEFASNLEESKLI